MVGAQSNGNSAEASTSPSPAPSSVGNNAPKFGTLVPNRVFVGGISASTTEQDLLDLFSKYGKVKATKVISDRAGVSKGYGFVTFETEEEARKLTQESDNIMLKDRKLNIAPAIKKQVSELGYIKPYSPRLVDGTTAGSILGTNGTVYFGNGQTYAYTNPVQVLASPTEYHQGVPGVPTPAVTHPTFPPQVPPSGTPTTVTAATQVPGTPTAAGYPTQFVYPHPVYFPQQYQQYQPATIQPSWTASPQLRWVSPAAFAQPYSSSPSGEVSSQQPCPKRGQTSHPNLSTAPNSPSYSFPPPIPLESYTPPPAFPFNYPLGQLYPITSAPCSTASSISASSRFSLGAVTSVTTVTTTTTTAIIGSSAQNGRLGSGEVHKNGALEIKHLSREFPPLSLEKAVSVDHHEEGPLSLNNESKQNGSMSPSLSQPLPKSFRKNSNKSTSECSLSSEEVQKLGRGANHSLNGSYIKKTGAENGKNPTLHMKGATAETESTRSGSMSSPDIPLSIVEKPDILHISLAEAGSNSYIRHGLDSSNISNVSLGLRDSETIWPSHSQVMGWSAWCPQHSLGASLVHTPSVPFHAPVWPHTPPLAMGNSSPAKSLSSNASHKIPDPSSPLSASSGSPSTSPRKYCGKTSTPKLECSSTALQKVENGTEDFLFGKPFVKMEPQQTLGHGSIPSGRTPFGMMTPTSPLMVVPWYHYAPVVNHPWYQWPSPPFMVQYPTSQNSSFCSSHPPTPTTSTPNGSFPFSGGTLQSPFFEQPQTASPPWFSNQKPLVHTSSGSQGRSAQSKKMTVSAGAKLRQPQWKTTPHHPMTSQHDILPNQNQEIHPPNSANNYPCNNPLNRRQQPLTEPARCLRRVAPLPDDRYTILPISPPLTPLQFDVAGSFGLSRNQPATR